MMSLSNHGTASGSPFEKLGVRAVRKGRIESGALERAA
jgi:hypothetical protein